MNLIESSKQSAVSYMEIFLRNFSHVPDDKLSWSPIPTAKSAIRVAAHTALYAGRFARMITERQLPQIENLESWLQEQNAEEEAITCRIEMETIFRQGTEDVISALDSLTPDAMELTLNSGPNFLMPMSQLMKLPGWHATVHLGQIDYLQTCWGDQTVYF